ncbi:nuclear speckle splicing regulatory protein 1 [Oncorhynchus mykiss]|nr:nuclear speckle splicing regulatory protein 1 [Oncorhynchus mykiss]
MVLLRRTGMVVESQQPMKLLWFYGLIGAGSEGRVRLPTNLPQRFRDISRSKMAAPSKQYGLIIPQKRASKTVTLPRPSVFGDDSDEETSVGESLQKEALKKRMMKQTRLEMQKALEQDSSVYDYDGVYDDMQKQRLESSKKMLGGTDRKPKYINQLLQAVEDRKKEQERRDERKIQKEREAEGEQFADKEAYVTSAYRQKLKERQEELEKEKREAAMEAALDVKKQKDLSGFYRHLLNQTVGEEAIPDRSVPRDQSTKEVKTEAPSPPSSPPSQDHVPSSHSDSEEGQDQKAGFSKPAPCAKRHYRQRSPSSGSGEEEREKDREREKKRHKERDRDQGRDRERVRERDREDRHGGWRDEKDGRKERDRDREEDRSRGRRDKEREERHGKRERSPKDREKENGEKEKQRELDKDKGRERDKGREKERNRDEEKKTIKTDGKDEKKEGEGSAKKGKEGEGSERKGKEGEGSEKGKEGGSEKGKESDSEKKGKEREEESKVSKFVKRSSEQTVTSARDRYLARQMARSATKTYIEKEED